MYKKPQNFENATHDFNTRKMTSLKLLNDTIVANLDTLVSTVQNLQELLLISI